MTQTSERPPRSSLLQLVRAARDAGMDAWATVTLKVTSSAPYSRATAVVARPGLVATAITRRQTERLMSYLLERANMPSRADVLALSVRLTHIETALDDLGAAVDSLRAEPRPAPRRPARNGRAAPRATEAVRR